MPKVLINWGPTLSYADINPKYACPKCGGAARTCMDGSAATCGACGLTIQLVPMSPYEKSICTYPAVTGEAK
jgi:hypothetical protein